MSRSVHDSPRSSLKSWILFLIFLLTLAPACDQKTDSKVVDFQKTVPAAKPEAAHSLGSPLKFAIGAMISPKATSVYYRDLLDYLGTRVGRPVELVQRKTYSELNELLSQGDIDVAWICSGPYFVGRKAAGFEAIAIPQIRKSPYYQAYLIVNRDSEWQTLADLKNRVFAFTDPDSLTGRLVPTYWLAREKEIPETFFSRAIYTYSHDNSILAVAKGLVDGASVDSLVWDYFQQADPKWTFKTRIIRRSDSYGMPPLVVSKGLSADAKEGLKQALFAMHEDPSGRKILEKLLIDRFTVPSKEWYAGIRKIEKMTTSLARQRHAPEETEK